MSDETSSETEIDPGEMSEEVAEEAQREEVDEEYPADEEAEEEPEPKPKPREDIGRAKPAPKKDEKPKPERKPLKVKVNGKEQEIPAEESEAIEKAAKVLGVDVDTLLRGPQMLRAGQERLRQAAEAEKQARAIKEGLSKDTKAALKAAGLSEQQIAQLGVSIVQELMEAEQLTPEQKRIRELEAKVKAEEDAKRETEEKQKAEEAQAYQTKVANKIADDITAALNDGKIPKDPYTVKRLASLMQDHLAKGGDADDLNLADFLPLLNESMKQEHTAYLGKLSGEDIIRLFPDTAEKVRKAYAARAQGRLARPPVQPKPAEERPERPDRKIRTTTDVLAAFRNGSL